MDASVHAGIAALERLGLTVADVGRPRVNLAHRSVFDATVDGRAAVVKVDAVPARSAREAVALRLAHGRGLPVPELLHQIGEAGEVGDDGVGGVGGEAGQVRESAEVGEASQVGSASRPSTDPAALLPSVLVLAKLDGTALPSHLSSLTWREAGFALRRIHSLPPDPRLGTARSLREGVQEWHEREIRRSSDNGLLPIAQRHAIHTLLSPVWANMADDSPSCLVHGDAQAEHFLIGPDRRISGVLDFADAHIGDPVCDLAVLTLDHPGQLEAVLSGYRPARATRERTTMFVEPYRILRRLAVANWMHDNGLDPTPHLNVLRTRVPVSPRTIRL